LSCCHCHGPIGKWPNRLHADRDERSPQPPTDMDGRQRQRGGLRKRWNKGQLAVGAAGGNWRRPWQWRRAERGSGASGRAKPGEGWGMHRCRFHLGLGRTRGARGRTRAQCGPTHFESKSEDEMGARIALNNAVCLDCITGPTPLSVRTRLDARCPFEPARWRCPYISAAT
jgi:hypothetical protein